MRAAVLVLGGLFAAGCNSPTEGCITLELPVAPAVAQRAAVAGGAPQVEIEVRLVGVESTFLQDIGVDFSLLADVTTDTGRNAGGTSADTRSLVVDSAVVGGVPGVKHLVPAGHRTDSFLGIVALDFNEPFVEVAALGMLPFFGCIDFATGAYEVPTGLPGAIAPQNLPPSDPGLGGSRVLYDVFDEAAFLDLLMRIDQDARNRIVNPPRVTVFNNQRSAFLVDELRPMRDELDPEFADAVGDVVDAPFRIVTGAALEVVPAIQGPQILLELRLGPEGVLFTLSTAFDVAGTPADVFLPLFRRSRNATSVTVPDGQTAVIAGLVREGASEPEPGIPVLGRIPVLSHLFAQRSQFNENQNLVIFVTPRIVRE